MWRACGNVLVVQALGTKHECHHQLRKAVVGARVHTRQPLYTVQTMIDRVRMQAEPPGACLHIEVSGGERVQRPREGVRLDFRRQRAPAAVTLL